MPQRTMTCLNGSKKYKNLTSFLKLYMVESFLPEKTKRTIFDRGLYYKWFLVVTM